MKLVLLVLVGVIIAAGITFYFQPNLISPDILARLPLPQILVFTPHVGQIVDSTFTLSGYAKSPPVQVYITNAKDIEIFSANITDSKFSLPIDLTRFAHSGDQIYLVLGPPLSPLTLPLTIK